MTGFHLKVEPIEARLSFVATKDPVLRAVMAARWLRLPRKRGETSRQYRRRLRRKRERMVRAAWISTWSARRRDERLVVEEAFEAARERLDDLDYDDLDHA